MKDLGECDWCDAWCDCREPATVHHLGAENEFCLRHFLQFEQKYSEFYWKALDRWLDSEIERVDAILEKSRT